MSFTVRLDDTRAALLAVAVENLLHQTRCMRGRMRTDDPALVSTLRVEANLADLLQYLPRIIL